MAGDTSAGQRVALCVSPQVLAEFSSVIANPRRVSTPFTGQEALADVEKIRALPVFGAHSRPAFLTATLLRMIMSHRFDGKCRRPSKRSPVPHRPWARLYP